MDRLDPPVCDPLPDAQPLCLVISIFSRPRLSAQRFQRLCNCPSDRPIYFSPPASLENTPSVLGLMSRGSSRQAGACLSSSSSFLETFQGRKWESPLMLVEPALPLTPIPVCVCVCVCGISFPEFLFRECLETGKPAAGFLRTASPPSALPWMGRHWSL